MGRATVPALSIMENVHAHGALIAVWAGTSSCTLWVTTRGPWNSVNISQDPAGSSAFC